MTKEIIKSQFQILFVDDEENARKYFDKGLKHNFNILTAASVDDAIEVLQEHHQNIAVVVTDQRMPGGNGVKLLKFLREKYPHIIRLLTTAYSDLTEAIDAVNSGEIFRYIQKPWDYQLLKTELQQAVDLFELRSEYNKLLHEKIMVRRKITKIERAKSLILFAKTLNFIRFSDISVQNFIKKFVVTSTELEADEDWQSFDFGNSDILETKFFLDVISKIQLEIPAQQDYSFSQNIDSVKINSFFEQQENLAISLQISNSIQAQVNEYSFGLIIKKLLQISKETTQPTTGLLIIEKVEGAVLINLKLEQFNLLEKANIFTQNPRKLAADFYVNLLICYLLASHHGGFVELTNGDQNFNCTVKLPDNPAHPIFSNSQLDSLENTILTAMIS